jgi:hypothetical protein
MRKVAGAAESKFSGTAGVSRTVREPARTRR